MPREDVGPAPLLVLGVDREQEAGLGRRRGLVAVFVRFPRLAVAPRRGPDLDDNARAAGLAARARGVAQGLDVDAAGADADLGPGDLVGRLGGEGGRGRGFVAVVGVAVAGGRRRLNLHRAVELGLEFRFFVS